MTQLPSGEGFHWSTAQRHIADDAVLDAREASRLASLDAEFRQLAGDVTGIEPNAIARPGRAVSDAQQELDQITDWLDGLIRERFGLDPDDAE